MSAPSEQNTSQYDIIPIGPLNEELVVSNRPVLPKSSEEIDIETFFTIAVAQRVSDVHLRVGQSPCFRKNGQIFHTKFPALTAKAIQRFAQWLIPEALKPIATKYHDFDFSLNFHKARFRVNLLHEMGQLAFVIRVIPATIPSLSDLGLPNGIMNFTNLDKGLVLITGATGSGKSTTLAALLDHINKTQQKHIITLEDPVEFVYKNKKAMITQRQLGIDTPNFPAGIKHALRQDPDILLIGEMRDRETAMTAIKAAETGVLVFSTLHTSDAIQTINRILDFFEPQEREIIRLQLGNVLQGTVAQKLYRLSDNTGMSVAAEILVVTPTIRDYLLKNELGEIYALMEDGHYEGMQSMNYSLHELINDQKITAEEALRVSNHPTELKRQLQGVYHRTTIID